MGGINYTGNLVTITMKNGREMVYAVSLLPWLTLSGDVKRVTDAAGRIIYEEDDEKALG